MEALLPIFLQAVLPILGTVLSGLVTWGSAELIKWVRTKTQNEQVHSALSRVTHTAQTVVAELSQTLVPQLLSATADGKLSAGDAERLKMTATTKVMEQLPDTVKTLATTGVNSLSDLISGKIEQAVYDLKK